MRPCTCHPEDTPPVPCQRKYALSECRVAASRPTEPKDIATLVDEFERAVENLATSGAGHMFDPGKRYKQQERDEALTALMGAINRLSGEPGEHPDTVRLRWLANLMLTCDYGDSPWGGVGWRAFECLPGARVLVGSSINEAIDSAMKQEDLKRSLRSSATKDGGAVSSADHYQRTGSPMCECGHRKAAHDHAGCCGVCGCVVWREQPANGRDGA